jgi:hypothetical protein
MITKMGYHRHDGELVRLYAYIGVPNDLSLQKEITAFAKQLIENGRLIDATLLLDTNIERCKKQGSLTNAVDLFLTRARLRFKMKAYDQARWDYKKALELCKELGMSEEFLEIEIELAELEYRSGLIHDAQQHFRHVAKHLPKDGNEQRIARINNLLSEFRRLETEVS